MPLLDICNENCIILFWTSGKLLPELLKLLKAWNLVFVNILLIWVKLTKN